MKTKIQKKEEIAVGKKLISGAKNVVFVDFGGVSFTLLGRLKKELKKNGSSFKVLKKRLLRIAFKENGMDFDPSQFDAQAGSIFVPGELSDGAAAIVYKFGRELAKEKKEFRILGAYDAIAKKFVTAEEFTVIAKLPSREVLLAQLMGMFTAPLRQFMFIVNELGKRAPAAASAASGEGQTVEQKQ